MPLVFGRGVYVDENTARPANVRDGALRGEKALGGKCGFRRETETGHSGLCADECAAAGRKIPLGKALPFPGGRAQRIRRLS